MSQLLTYPFFNLPDISKARVIHLAKLNSNRLNLLKHIAKRSVLYQE